MERVRVIGVGNPFRRDDAAGLEAARRLRALDMTGIDVLEAGGEGADLMDRWEGCERVVLIDAVRSGATPGTVHRLDACSQAVPQRFFSYSTHAFSVAEAVELARQLGRLPGELLIFGIEGGDFSAGEGLTPQVKRSVDNVVKTIVAMATEGRTIPSAAGGPTP